MSTPFHVVIPARWHSTRLPEKMLADLGGIPLVVRTAQQALQSQAKSVTVATDDERILQAVQSFGLSAILTDRDHSSGTDRLAQAARLLALPDDCLIVNVQGDEPRIAPALIDQVAQALAEDSESHMSTCAKVLTDETQRLNPNVVKVVCDRQNRALYFSRAAIPHIRENALAPCLHHIGLYAYRNAFLQVFSRLAPGLLEQTESLEQLRVLENGYRIHVAITTLPHEAGVDTHEDLERIRRQYT